MAETSKLDEMFKNRYSQEDERYKKMSEEGFEKVIVIHPWNPRRENNFRGRGGGYGGGRGGNSNRGGWQPRGGHRGWQGDRQPRRDGGGGGEYKRRH